MAGACGVWGVGFRVKGLGVGVGDLGFEIWGLGYGVQGLGFGVWDLGQGFGVWASGFRVRGLHLRVLRWGVAARGAAFWKSQRFADVSGIKLWTRRY